MYGDPEAIRALARTMGSQAEQVDAEAARLTSRAGAVDWRGLAADAMRAQVGGQAALLRHAAARHEEAALALEDLAQEVARVRALIASAERAVSEAVHAARARVERLARGAADTIEAGDQALAALRLPAPGSPDWLHVHLPATPRLRGLW